MAEATTGQVETQPALEALTPNQAVEHLTQAIETQVAEAEKPRDDKGKFVKKETSSTEAAEAKPTEEAPKAEAEETAPTEEQPEIQPEPRRFKLKYKGEDREVEEPEVITLAQQGYDYTQKTQALAKERAELDAKVKAETEAARKTYEQQLEMHKQAVLRLADQEAMTANLDKLSQEDPARALQLMIKRQQIHQTLGGIAQEQARIAQQRDVETQTAKQKQVQEALEIIQRDIPDWGAEKYGKILKAAVSNGFSQDEANAITDPKVVKLLDKARQWDEYVAAKPKTVDKRIAAVPKVQKPGTSEKADAKPDKVKESMARLGKTGTRGDAENYIQALIDAGRIS